MTDMTEIVLRVVNSRGGGKVERCHAVPHLGSYNNAAHSWGVAMLLHYLFPEDFPRLVIYALSHDVPEFWVGDIPAPTLRYTVGVREQLADLEARISNTLGLPAEAGLMPEDLAKLKACDRLELWLWCREEQLRGNMFVDECLSELERYFVEAPLPEVARRFLQTAQENELLPRQQGVVKAMNSR